MIQNAVFHADLIFFSQAILNVVCDKFSQKLFLGILKFRFNKTLKINIVVISSPGKKFKKLLLPQLCSNIPCDVSNKSYLLEFLKFQI